jgi:predicted ArsR family transcriptional regulator
VFERAPQLLGLLKLCAHTSSLRRGQAGSELDTQAASVDRHFEQLLLEARQIVSRVA